ncbi:maleylpyruvate isomerase family mycothiol-dependent enzyme [Actinokineospora enzanensis]|uniref:maleylpyruvate isomerase family mycothiol-dependent enzyme n=1 Tax=Actinokineospora enzanensis TaxID=155975 RepID=UPI00035E4E69|nr:maleylpyruvate isomerase family mycothiol-dependent enzyme [Actinokineospora enzanensis]
MDYLAAWRTQNHHLVELFRSADPTVEIPSCPGWTVRQLVAHVGRGDRWCARVVQLGEFIHPDQVEDTALPEDPAAVVEWLRRGPDLLDKAVDLVGPETPVWTFVGDRPAAWWLRRRMAETVVHHADLALALDVPFEVAPATAADSVSEWLDLVAARPPQQDPLADGTSLHLHATDDAGEWLITSGPKWTHAHEKATVALRAPAADLLLVLLRRLPPERVEIVGDRAPLDAWLASTPF